MEFDVGVFIAQLLNFAVLYFFFQWALADKLTAVIKYRRSLDEKYADVATDIEKKLVAADLEKQQLILEGVEHKQKIVEEAALVADKKAATILEKANKEAKLLVSAGEKKAESLSANLEKEFVSGVKHTAHIVVNKLFNKDVDLKDAYLEQLAKESIKE